MSFSDDAFPRRGRERADATRALANKLIPRVKAAHGSRLVTALPTTHTVSELREQTDALRARVANGLPARIDRVSTDSGILTFPVRVSFVSTRQSADVPHDERDTPLSLEQTDPAPPISMLLMVPAITPQAARDRVAVDMAEAFPDYYFEIELDGTGYGGLMSPGAAL